MSDLDQAREILNEILANPPSGTVYRKITNKNKDSENLVLYRKDLVLYGLGLLKEFVLVDESGKEIERYYGYGLRNMIKSHWPQHNYFLAKRSKFNS